MDPIDPERTDLVEEFRRNPFGPHSVELAVGVRGGSRLNRNRARRTPQVCTRAGGADVKAWEVHATVDAPNLWKRPEDTDPDSIPRAA